MMTFNIKVDLDNPSTSKFEVPSNMPYAVRLELYKGNLEHAAWDGEYGVGNVIPTSQSYEAKFSGGKWINSSDVWKDGFFGEEEGSVTVDSENPNIVTLNCVGRDVGSDGVKLLINTTDTNWDAIPEEDETIGEGDADPRLASRIEIVFKYVSKEGCKPTGGGGDIPENIVKTDEVNEITSDVEFSDTSSSEIPVGLKVSKGTYSNTYTGNGIESKQGNRTFEYVIPGDFMPNTTQQITTREWVNSRGYVTKESVNQITSNVAFQGPSNMGIVAMDSDGANMTSVTPVGVAYTKDGMGLVVQPPSDETGNKTVATREWVGDQTITMSGTYDDDTEFSFSIKGSN